MRNENRKLFRKILFFAGFLMFIMGVVFAFIGCVIFGAVKSVGDTCLLMTVMGLLMIYPTVCVDGEI